MRSMFTVFVAFFFTLLSLLMFTASATAQTDVVESIISKAETAAAMVEAACGEEFKKYCSTVTPGDGRLALCLIAHEDKISDTCYATFFDVADSVELAISNIWRGAEACNDDIEKVCATVVAGEGRIAQCLIQNKASVSPTCRSEIAVFQARIKN